MIERPVVPSVRCDKVDDAFMSGSITPLTPEQVHLFPHLATEEHEKLEVRTKSITPSEIAIRHMTQGEQ